MTKAFKEGGYLLAKEFDFKTAIKINRYLIITIIIGAIAYILSASDSLQVDKIMTGVIVELNNPIKAESMQIRLQGTLNNSLIKGTSFNGNLSFDDKTYKVSKNEVLDLSTGKQRAYGSFYYDETLSQLTLLIGEWGPDNGMMYIAPAKDRKDALQVANDVLSTYMKKNALKPLD